MTAKRLIILGAGESGVSAARLARRQGYSVFVSDHGAGVERFVGELDAAGIDYELNGHTEAKIFEASEVVKSPGIPDTAPMIVALRERNVPVISEVEFAYRYAPAGSKIVGITGSNGKTTTTLLTHHLLASAGVKAIAGGNLGDSFARLLVEQEPQDVYVLELSSFQLDGIVNFRPDIAALLNITPDHLDRYGGSMERYATSKWRIATNQRAEDYFLALKGAPLPATPPAREATVSIDPDNDLLNGQLRIEDLRFDLEESQLQGRHNAINALFAVRIALLLGVKADDIRLALNTFRPAPHRMEIIPTQDGRTWINDSKATNVDATYFALEAMAGPTVWIAGGVDKGNDYDVLLPLVRDRVHTLICLGLDNDKLRGAFAGEVDRLAEVNTAAAAVTSAASSARIGERILLSPACASFDLFENYIDRGDQFRALVQNIAG